MEDKINQAAEKIANSKYLVGFTGAGISVESGIPPFRGENGIWNKYDERIFDLNYFKNHPKESWELIKNVFLEFSEIAKPNAAHFALAEIESRGFLKTIITQNIDNLHQAAGSKNVIEFHGSLQKVRCTNCDNVVDKDDLNLNFLPPKCPKCGGLMKPDIIFFGEGIPVIAYNRSFEEVGKCDVLLMVGTSGQVMPASFLPQVAQQKGATIIEVNLNPSSYTNSITDIYLEGKATEVLNKLIDVIEK